MRVSASCSTLLLLLLSLWVPLTFAADDTLPTESQIQQSLRQLDAKGADSATTKPYRDLYEAMLQKFQALNSLQQQLDDLAKKLREAPAKTIEARRELQSLKVEPMEELSRRFSNLSANELERQAGAKYQQLTEWKTELSKINTDIISAQTRPERAQADITAFQEKEQALQNEVKTLQRKSDDPLSQLHQQMKQLEIAEVRQENLLLRQQLSSNGVLMDYATARREVLSRRIESMEQELYALIKVLHDMRREQSQEIIAAAASAAADSSQSPLIREQSEINRGLSDEILSSANQIEELTQQIITARQNLDRFDQVEQALNEQIAVLKDSLLLSRILQQQKRSLPVINLDRHLPDQVADIRLRQFEISQDRDALRTPIQFAEALQKERPDAALAPEQQKDLQRILEARRNLLDRLNSQLDSALGLAINLQIVQRQLQFSSTKLNATLDEQLFWIASSRMLDRDWWTTMPKRLSLQIERMPWLRMPQVAISSMQSQYWLWAGLLIAAVLYFYWRRTIRQRLDQISSEVGRFRTDSAWHTPLAFLLNALLVAPLPLLLVVVGLLLSRSLDPSAPHLGVALLHLALAIFVLRLFQRTLRKDGIAERHFRWERGFVATLRAYTKPLLLVFCTLVFIISLAEQNPANLPDDVLGVLVMLVGCLLLSLLLGRVMWICPPIYDSRLFHGGVSLILVLFPLCLLIMVGLGYYYTALKLADRFILSFYLLLGWLVASGIAERSLRVAANKLGYQRALAKREAEKKEGAEGEAVVDTNEMNMQQINEQSMRLISLGLIVGFSALVYWVWSDLITLFTYLDTVNLWEYSVTVGEATEMVPISLLDAIGALVVLALTILLARNLPGLLEILVLSKMQLRQGSAYATKTLLSYVIIGIGLVSTLSTLGVSWDKLQWLVAALSVGLGFGLQEIFANFVSGLIILFERPVRIGDTVTIGDLSGTVSRIRIRATTITDFDRKDIIVPNKNFVTDRLVNWSLTDTITRVVLKYGVAYGSDLELVRQLLMQIAEDNPRVLRDPAPVVFFLSIGASTLDHDLRVHVKELGDRLAVTDEINREVDRLFAQHNIELAFQQVDLRLRNSEGLEQVVEGITHRRSGPQGEAPLPTAGV